MEIRAWNKKKECVHDKEKKVTTMETGKRERQDANIRLNEKSWTGEC